MPVDLLSAFEKAFLFCVHKHHSSPHCVRRVREQNCAENTAIAEEPLRNVVLHLAFESVEDAEVCGPKYGDSHEGDQGTSIYPSNSLSADCVSKPGEDVFSKVNGVIHAVPGEFQRVEDGASEESSECSAEVVLGEGKLQGRMSRLEEEGLEEFLEAPVQGFGRVEFKKVGEISFPEGTGSFFSPDSMGTIDDAPVWPLKLTLAYQFRHGLHSKPDEVNRVGQAQCEPHVDIVQHEAR